MYIYLYNVQFAIRSDGHCNRQYVGCFILLHFYLNYCFGCCSMIFINALFHQSFQRSLGSNCGSSIQLMKEKEQKEKVFFEMPDSSNSFRFYFFAFVRLSKSGLIQIQSQKKRKKPYKFSCNGINFYFMGCYWLVLIPSLLSLFISLSFALFLSLSPLLSVLWFFLRFLLSRERPFGTHACISNKTK